MIVRVCIRPEISRTKTIGKKGVSIGTYFTQHLQYIVLNTDPVDFTKKNLTYLKKVPVHITFWICTTIIIACQLQDIYDKEFITGVNQLPLVTIQQVVHGTVPHNAARLQYSSNKEFESMAKQLKLMSDLRVSIPVFHTSILSRSLFRLVCHVQHTKE